MSQSPRNKHDKESNTGVPDRRQGERIKLLMFGRGAKTASKNGGQEWSDKSKRTSGLLENNKYCLRLCPLRE